MGVGVPAPSRVLRVVHAMAHVEGGAALRARGANACSPPQGSHASGLLVPSRNHGARGGGGAPGAFERRSGAARYRQRPRARRHL